MNYKRRKPRRQVKCNICTDSRFGNSSKNSKRRTVRRRSSHKNIGL